MPELRLDEVETQDVEDETAQGWVSGTGRGDGERGGSRGARAWVTAGGGEPRGSQGPSCHFLYATPSTFAKDGTMPFSSSHLPVSARKARKSWPKKVADHFTFNCIN